jgi:hypothetical protein
MMRWSFSGPLVQVKGAPGPQGQARLGAVERLNSGLFVDARHQRMVGRTKVEPQDVQQLRGNLRSCDTGFNVMARATRGVAALCTRLGQ